MSDATLPHADDAERAVLGGVLVAQSSITAFEKVAAIVECRDFYSARHRAIFAAIARLHAEDVPADLPLLRDELERTDDLESAGGVAYLASLVDGTARSPNVEHYAKIVKETAALRTIVRDSERLTHVLTNGATRDERLAAIEDHLRLVETSADHLDRARRVDNIDCESGDSILARPVPSPRVAIEGLLGEREVLIVSGTAGLGKSWATLSLAASLATGRPVFASWAVSRPYRVAVLDLEDGPDHIARRLHRLAAGFQLAPEHFTALLVVRERLRLDDPGSVRRLLAFAERERVEFVLIDSLRRAFLGDENASGTVSGIFTSALDPLKGRGCGAILVDHTRKVAGDRALDAPEEMLRGSSDKRALCDAHVGMEKREERLAWIPTKVRHGRLPEPVLLALDGLDEDDEGPVEVRVVGPVDRASDAVQDAALALLRDAGEAGLLRGELIGRSKYSERSVGLALAQLVKRGRATKRTEGKQTRYVVTTATTAHDGKSLVGGS